jgi:uncharacterized membrane protein YsdA (DUF1294 family)/cold shock CspA family protein
MRFEGHIKSWTDDRGFGFIEPTQGGEAIFVHIKAFAARTGRPQINQPVSFEVELNHEGKKRAKNVAFIKPARTTSRSRINPATQWGTASLFAIPSFAALYLLVAILWKVPNKVARGYLLLSRLCFVAYYLDKSAAASDRWRTKESTLLFFGLLGGWPGAILAQQFLRHKSTKAAFRSAFWGTVVVNVGAFMALSSPFINAWRLLL